MFWRWLIAFGLMSTLVASACGGDEAAGGASSEGGARDSSAGGTDPEGTASAGAETGAVTTGGPIGPKELSQSCADHASCISGFCPPDDGVCCDSACDAPCMACLSDKTGVPNGSCAPILPETDPDDDCSDDGFCWGGAGCCDDPVTPPGGDCPSECTSCDDGTCIFECNSEEECGELNFSCPEGFACRVLCTSKQACEGLELECPAQYACEVVCLGDGACRSAVIQCSTGTCSLTCKSDNSCENTKLDCGGDACRASCANRVNKDPNVECNDSCQCESC